MDKDYNNVSNRFSQQSNFKEIYSSFHTANPIFYEETFDKKDPNWRNDLKSIEIYILYLYRVEEFNIFIEPKYKDNDEEKKEHFLEYLMDYNYKRVNQKLVKPISERLINIYKERYGKEARKEKYDNKYSKGLLGKDILSLFHPLLLNEFKKYGIQLHSRGKIIEPNSFIEIQLSSDT